MALKAWLEPAFLELGKRLLTVGAEQRVAIHSPQDIANLLMAEMGFLEQEHLRVLLLSTHCLLNRWAPGSGR